MKIVQIKTYLSYWILKQDLTKSRATILLSGPTKRILPSTPVNNCTLTCIHNVVSETSPPWVVPFWQASGESLGLYSVFHFFCTRKLSEGTRNELHPSIRAFQISYGVNRVRLLYHSSRSPGQDDPSVHPVKVRSLPYFLPFLLFLVFGFFCFCCLYLAVNFVSDYEVKVAQWLTLSSRFYSAVSGALRNSLPISTEMPTLKLVSWGYTNETSKPTEFGCMIAFKLLLLRPPSLQTCLNILKPCIVSVGGDFICTWKFHHFVDTFSDG